MLSYQDAQTMMARAQDRGYGPRRKLQNNTYLVERGSNYAVRLHNTDVVAIHADGTYTLNTGGWETVTTKDRINGYGPARVYSHRGVWAVWHSSDPHMPAKLQKCRTCKGTGLVTVNDWGTVSYYHPADYSVTNHYRGIEGRTYPCSEWSYDFAVRWNEPVPTALQRNGWPLRDQPETVRVVGQWHRHRGMGVTGQHQATCHNCHGSKVADYGSQQRPAIFYDGIRVDSSGMVIDPNAKRLYETPEEKAARLETEARERAEAVRRLKAAQRRAKRDARNARPRWLAERGLTLSDDGKTVTLVKAVLADLSSPVGHGDIRYEIGSTVTAEDYTPEPHCGHGLHFCATAEDTREYVRGVRFLACAVDYASMVPVGNKVKARSCTVLYEISEDGRRIQHTAWDDLPAGTAGRD